MKKTLTLLSILIAFVAIVSGCTKTPPLSERIAKTWTARVVKEGNSIVYSKGGSSNSKPGYSAYSLNLGSTSSVTLREVEGTTFSGTYSLVGETKLVLSGLTPQPTDSNGTLEFTIQSITDTELILQATTAYTKTGGTLNVYTLEAL